MTEWREIPRFSGYEVSENGRIRRVVVGGRGHKPADVTGWLHHCGGGARYLRVGLRLEGRTVQRYVHQIVCESFHGPQPSPVHQVNHKDGNKQNNSAANLEWLTKTENMRHAHRTGLIPHGENGGRAKLTEDRVRQIRDLLDEGRLTHSEIAEIFGVTRSNIGAINTGRSWAWL